MENTRLDTRKLVTLAIFTAIVAVLQLMGVAIRFGTFAVSMVGVPVILGGALMGPAAGAWLGLVFGITVLVSGDAALFFAWDPVATVVIVLLKGTLAGFAASALYQILERKSGFLAVLAAAIIMTVFIGFNFFFELGLDLVLSGVIDRLIYIGKRSLKRV